MSDSQDSTTAGITEDRLQKMLEGNDDDFLKFEKIDAPRSRRPDLHAFLLLDELVPGIADIVSAAQHDEVFLGVEPKDLAPKISEAQVRELIQCGVRWSEYGCLAMFVSDDAVLSADV